jgi:hypothetical protein
MLPQERRLAKRHFSAFIGVARIEGKPHTCLQKFAGF